MSSSLCRICLKDDAEIPLFDRDNTENDVVSQLCMCLNEKIEDIDGYPRNICNNCYKALQDVYEFIKKFKDSCNILQNKLLVKIERIELSKEESNNEFDNGICIDIENVKKEVSDNECTDDINTTEHIKHNTEIVKLNNNSNRICAKSNAQKKNIVRPKTKSAISTNRIASSILEGNYIWIGDTWCVKPPTTKSTNVIKKDKQIANPQKKQVRIKLPKVKKPNPPRLCDLCGQIFKSQEKLCIHKKKVHFKKIIKCPQCPRILSSEYYLNAHLRRIHQHKKDFICATCGRGFAFKGELANHNKVVHNKHLLPKKRFACKICNKEYKCLKSVVIHERSAHTGLRPAVCTVCDSSFYHEDYLKEHMRLHTGETPFKCPICDRGYAQRGNMKSHLRIHRISELDAQMRNKLRPSYLKLLKP